MSIQKGQIVMWFTRYGSTEMHFVDDLEEAYDLAWMLEAAETCVFDQYGCLGEVEVIGWGAIPEAEWDRSLEQHKARKTAEREAEQAAKRAAGEVTPRPYGVVDVLPPDVKDRQNYGAAHGLVTAYSSEELDAEAARVTELLGADRVRTRIYKAVGA